MYTTEHNEKDIHNREKTAENHQMITAYIKYEQGVPYLSIKMSVLESSSLFGS